MTSLLRRTTLLAAAAALAAAPASAASYVWDGVTGSYVLTSADDFTYTAGASSAGGLDVTARDFDISGNLTLGGAFSFTQTGGGSLYQGVDLLTSATITASAITLSGDIGKQASDGNTLTLNTSAANGAINLNVSLGRSGVWYIPAGLTANAGSGTITVSGTGPASSGWRTANVSLTGGAINITGNVNSGGSVTLNNSLAGTVSGALSGAMTLTKGGAGVLTLSNAGSSFTGNMVISAGEVRVTSTTNNTTPTATGLGNMNVARTITVQSGAVLRFGGPDVIGQYNHAATATLIADGGTITRDLAAAGTRGTFNSVGNVILRNGGALVSTNGNADISALVGSFALNGTVTVDGASATGATISPEASQTFQNYINLGTNGSSSTTFAVGETNTDAVADLTVSAVLANKVLGGGATLIKSGAGRMVLSASNAYSGGTTLRAGTLVATNANALGTGAVTVNDASTSTSNTTLLIDATAGAVNLARAVTVANQGSGTVTLGSASTAGTNAATFSGAVTLNKAATLTGGSAGDRLAFTGGITGTANVTIAGTNRVIFSGSTVNYAGTTTVNSGAALQLSDGTSTTTSYLADAQDVTVNGTLNLAKGANGETIGALNGSGTVNQLVAGAATLTVGNGGGNGTFSGALTNTSGTLALTKSGAGTQTLSGASTYTGATSVTNGTLALGTGGSLGNTAVTVSSAAAFTTASGTTVGGSVTANSGSTLTANGTLSGAVSVAGTATLSGSLGSTLGVSGTATVASGGSVTGATTLSAGGTLTANGTLGTVGVASGSTLRGSGSLGATTVANGTASIVAGNGTSGSLTLSALTFDGTATLNVGSLVNYTSTSAFVVTNALTLNGGTVTLALPAGIISNGTYKLISYGSTTATDANFTVSGPVIGARQTGGLEQDVANKVFQYVVAGDSPKWTGANGSAFSGGSNWVLINAGTSTDFLANDSLLLDDSASSYTVDISGGNVAPAAISFENATANYVLQGDSGLSSGTLAKSGAGDLRINNANSATSVAISGGSVTLGASGALGTSAVTLSGGTLDLNSQTTAAAITLSGGSIAGNGTVSGVVSGLGSLAKSSAGTLTLSAQNTFTGGTTVSNGVLVLGHATNTLADAGAVTVSGGELSLGSNTDTVGAVTVSGGSVTGSGTLTGSSYTVTGGTVSAKLGGAGALTKSGAGTATLSGANTYFGGTTVTDGTLAIGDNAALGTGSVALNGGALQLSGQTVSNAITLGGGSVSGNGTVSGTLSGASAFTKSGNGALVLSGAQNPAGGISVTGGTLEISGSLNAGSYAGTIASNGSGALALTGNANQTLSGVISGSSGLTKSGTGTLTLSGGSSTLTGDILVSGGKVVVSGVSGTASSSNPTVSALGNMTTAGRTITVGSGAILEIAASDAIGAYNYATPVTLIADGGTIAAGLAPVGTRGAFRSLGNLTLRNGGSLVTANGNAPLGTLVGSFAFNGNVTVDGASATGATISPEATQTFQNYINLGTVSGTTTFTVAETNDAATADLTVSTTLANKVLGGAAALTKAGNGRMVLAASNAYTGATTISGGTLAITSGGGIYRGAYAGTSLSIASGATLEVETWHYDETIASLGGLSANAGNLIVSGGTIRVTGASTSYGRGVTVNSGGVTLEAASGANWTVDTVNDSQAWVYNGNPSVTLGGAGTGTFQKVLGLGTGSLTKSGTGTWTLSGTNTYSGGTTVSNGTLRLGASGALGSGAVTLSGGALDLNGQTVASSITLSGGTISGSGTANGVLSGTGALTKSSAGTLTLGGSNTYSGGTAVSNGTLRVGNDAALGSGAVTLSGGTLDVDGRTLANDITLSGGALSGAATLSGVLSGNGGLFKSTAGLLALSGANTFTGATDVTNGTLALLSGGSLAADSAVTVGSGATLRVDAGASILGATTLQSGATLRGAGSLGAVTVDDGFSTLVAGSGTLTVDSLALGGAVTLSFGTLTAYELAPGFSVTGALTGTSTTGLIGLSLPGGIVPNGTYQLLAFGSTDLDVGSFNLTGPLLGGRQAAELQKTDSAFVYVVSGTSPKWTGANGTAFSGGGNWTIIGGDGSPDDYIAADVLLVDDTATGTVLDISGADVAPTAINFDNVTKDFTLQGANGASGTLAKSGAGSVTLSNANTFSSVALTAGRLVLDNDGALGSASVALSGGVLDLNGSSTDAAVSLEGGAIEGSGTVSGVISGSIGLSKSSPGTLTLAATNTFTGGTTVSDGVLALGNASDTLADGEAVTVTGGELALGSNSDTIGALAVSGGIVSGSGTLTAASVAVSGGTLSVVLGGSTGLTKSGSGTATLSGANTYSGGTSVTNGTLAVGDDAALGSGSVTLSGGALSLSGQTLANAVVFSGGSVTGTGTLSGAVSGASAFVKSGSGTIELAGSQTLASGMQVTGGGLAITGTLGGGTYAGLISGSGAVGFLSTSDQVISGGANTLTGDIVISGAKLTVSAASGTAQGTNPTNSGLGNMTTAGRVIEVNGVGSVLEFATADAIGAFGYQSPVLLVASDGGVITRTAGAFNSIGSLLLDNGGVLRANSGQNATVNSMSINGNVAVTGTDAGGLIESVGVSNAGIHLRSVGSSGNVTFDVADTAAATDLQVTAKLLNPVQVNYFTYNAAGTAAGIIKTGAGTMSLEAANTFSGGVTVSAGTLRVGVAGALGSGAVTLSGGSLDLNGLTVANAITASGGSVSGSGILSGLISGSGSLGIDAVGTVTLSGANSFSGGLLLSSGTLVIGNVGSLGTGAVTLSGGTLDLGGLAVTNAINFAGGSLINAASATSSVTVTGTVTTQELNDLPGTEVSLGDGANVDLTGVTKTVVITGAPTVANLASFTGTLAVAGSLDLSAAGNRPVAATLEVRAGGTLDFGSDTAFAGTVDYKGGSIQGAFTGTANVASTGVALVDGALSGGTIVVGTGASVDVSSYTGSVRLTGGSVSQGLGGFSGTLELADGGSLNITAESPASATILVADGGVLRGTGSAGSATVTTGGILAPGNSPGLQTFTTLALEGGSSYQLEIQSTYAGLIAPVAGTDYDSISVTGQLDLSGLSSANRLTLDLISLIADGSAPGDLADFDPSVPLVFDVFTYGGITSYAGSIEDYFTVDTSQLTYNGSALSGANFSLHDTGTSIQLHYSPIPEPSTYGLILGGLALAGAAIRRRKKAAK